MQQKMVMADFEKSLAILIAKQRNPKVPNMTLNDAVQIALKQNPDILNAIQQIRLTRGQLIQVAAQAVPQLVINSSYNKQQEDLFTNGSGRRGGSAIELIDGSGRSVNSVQFQILAAAGLPSFHLAAAGAAPSRTKPGIFNFKPPSSFSTAARPFPASRRGARPTIAPFSVCARS
jgi:hypothetical protein